MVIEVNYLGPNQYIATAKDDNHDVIFTSNKHSRPGCAARDAINYVNYKNGMNATFIQLDLKEWR